MGYTTVKFLGNDFDVPDTINQYLDYEKFFVPCINKLISDVTKIVDKDSICKPSVVVGERMSNNIPKYCNLMDTFTDNIVKKLISCEIYDVTAKDLNDNESYKQMIINLSAKVTMKSLEEGQVFLQMKQMGMANAYNYASSQITGTGFGIITNSFSSLMIYSAIETHSLLSQAKKADEEYNKAIQNITRKVSDGFERTCKDILINEYYPMIYSIFADFTSKVVSAFYTYLSAHNKFDFDSISEYNMKKSDSMLKNIKSASNKKEFLIQSFLKCPFNPSVYNLCIDLELMDIDTIKTAQYFGLSKELTENIKQQCINNLNNHEILIQFLNLYSCCENINIKDAFLKIFSNKIDTIKLKYQNISKAINDDKHLVKWICSNITKSSESLCKYSETENKVKIDKILSSILSENLYKTFNTLGIDIIDLFKIPCSQNKSLSEINSELQLVLMNSMIKYIEKLKNYRERTLFEYQSLKQEYDKTKLLYDKQIDDLTEQQNRLKFKRSALGFFDFSKKKEIENKISEFSYKINEVHNKIKDLDSLKAQYTAKLYAVDKFI